MPSDEQAIYWEPSGTKFSYRWHSDWWVLDALGDRDVDQDCPVWESLTGIEVRYGRIEQGPYKGSWGVEVEFDHDGMRRMVGLTEDEAQSRAETLVRAIRTVWPESDLRVREWPR